MREAPAGRVYRFQSHSPAGHSPLATRKGRALRGAGKLVRARAVPRAHNGGGARALAHDRSAGTQPHTRSQRERGTHARTRTHAQPPPPLARDAPAAAPAGGARRA
jgi:hypothetical protein